MSGFTYVIKCRKDKIKTIGRIIRREVKLRIQSVRKEKKIKRKRIVKSKIRIWRKRKKKQSH